MSDNSPKSGGPAFVQTGWTVTNVYNIAGNFALTKDSSAPDFAKALDELKAEIRKLPGLDADRKAELTSDVDAVKREAGRDQPAGGAIVSRLGTIQSTLEAVKGTAQGALELGKTVATMAAWAAAFFR